MNTPPLYCVAQSFPPQAGSASAAALARGLACGGWDVKVWTLAAPSEYYRNFCIDPSLEGGLPGVTIIRTPAIGNIMLGNIVRTACFSQYAHPTWTYPVSGELRRMAQRQPGVFFGSFPGRDNVLLASHAARQTHLPLWLDFRCTPLLFRGLKEALSHADVISVATPCIEKTIHQLYPAFAGKIFISPHGAGCAQPPVRLVHDRPELQMLCTGHFGTQRDIPLICAAMEKLHRHMPDVATLIDIAFLGNETKKTRAAFPGGRIVNSCHFEGFQSYTGLIHMMREADALVLALPANYPQDSIPDAVFEAMACGTPVILSARHGAAQTFVQEEGIGLITPAEDASALAEAIVRFSVEFELRQSMRAHTISRREHYDLERNTALTAQRVRECLFGK